jgi:hypothetical protein
LHSHGNIFKEQINALIHLENYLEIIRKEKTFMTKNITNMKRLGIVTVSTEKNIEI